MSKSIARPARRALCATLVAVVCGALAAGSALAAGPVVFQHEGYQAFLGQLRHREVHAVEFHTQALKIHAALNNGSHVSVVYPAGKQAQITTIAHAHGAGVAVALAKSAAPAHHKLRYIAGGVLIVVILVLLVVLLVGRRRGIVETDGPSPTVSE